MRKSYAPHLALIRESLAAIEDYRPARKTAFLESPLLQDAVLMRLQVIGESLAQMRDIDADAFEELGDDSWNKVIGLRNIISHGYRSIDPERIWQVMVEELPIFTGTIAAATRRIDEGDQP